MKTKRPDLAEIYERAAERIKFMLNDGCCWAINASSLRVKRRTAIDNFVKHFKPENDNCNYWFGSTYENEIRNHRITALLLMAEMARRGGFVMGYLDQVSITIQEYLIAIFKLLTLIIGFSIISAIFFFGYVWYFICFGFNVGKLTAEKCL